MKRGNDEDLFARLEALKRGHTFRPCSECELSHRFDALLASYENVPINREYNNRIVVLQYLVGDRVRVYTNSKGDYEWISGPKVISETLYNLFYALAKHLGETI